MGPASPESEKALSKIKCTLSTSSNSMESADQEDIHYNAIQGQDKRENLEHMSKDELISKIRAMELHVKQLRNIIAKSSGNTTSKRIGKRKPREFNHDKFRRRHILLRFCYLGWDYQGLASQEDTARTIEAELFRCLQLTRLVRDRQTANYHRCGRTDKGVSAFSQAISLDVRSQQLVDPSDPAAAATLPPDQEINYPVILNKVLPPEIRVFCWSPAAPEASARFDCRARTYRYFFPRGDLNLQAMQDAAGRLCGHHDFRNLCKMDVGNGVVEYRRRLERVSLTTLDAPPPDGDDGSRGYQMCQLEVRGNAFLWHQIRCMVAVLFLVGEGLEEPSIIDQLLDVQATPRKPQYSMASELPLNLFDVEYDAVEWHCDPAELRVVVETLQQLWTQTAVRSAMLRSMLAALSARHGIQTAGQTRCLTAGVRPRLYTPLLQRPTCGSLEERVGHYVKRRKLDPALLEHATAAARPTAGPGAVGDGGAPGQGTPGSGAVRSGPDSGAPGQGTPGSDSAERGTNGGSGGDAAQTVDSSGDAAVNAGNSGSSAASSIDSVSTTGSLEERVGHYVKRRKLDPALLEHATAAARPTAGPGAVGDGGAPGQGTPGSGAVRSGPDSGAPGQGTPGSDSAERGTNGGSGGDAAQTVDSSGDAAVNAGNSGSSAASSIDSVSTTG